MFEWAYDGINSSIPRNVGPECANYLSLKRRIIETLFISVFIISCIVWGLKHVTLPKKVVYVNQDCVGRRVLLIIMSLVLGMEIGFKFTSRTVIYLLNPCHITTALQLYLLAADPSPTVTAIFRIHLNLLNGPVLAYLFPETESRIIFADKSMYYIQHGLMLVIPYYLLRIGGNYLYLNTTAIESMPINLWSSVYIAFHFPAILKVAIFKHYIYCFDYILGVYNIEPFSDMSWSILSFGLNAGYHFWILQSVALPVQVNLSHMLCAAVLDPFEGQNYRIWAVTHQSILCPTLSKLFSYGSNFFLTKFPPTRVKPTLECTIPKMNCTHEQNEKLHEDSNTSGNGHTHFD